MIEARFFGFEPLLFLSFGFLGVRFCRDVQIELARRGAWFWVLFGFYGQNDVVKGEVVRILEDSSVFVTVR